MRPLRLRPDRGYSTRASCFLTYVRVVWFALRSCAQAHVAPLRLDDAVACQHHHVAACCRVRRTKSHRNSVRLNVFESRACSA